jgi:ubiquinone/menaquinone biosynthesis C-methylase UbiE
MSQEPHSILYFGDTRDAWWNDDFLALMAARVQLATRRRVLDVGTGFGHFARAWLPHFAPGTELVGVDPEPVSIAEAERRTTAFAASKHLSVELSFQLGRVESLPFEDASFDVVMAQTVLIHVPDVDVALREMARVLAPGGLLLLAEPNNMAGQIAPLAFGPQFDVEKVLRVAALEMRCEIGKARLGLGFNSLGEVLVKHIPSDLYTDVRVWIGDKAAALAPPYATPQQQTEIAERRDFAARGIWGWEREEARRYYMASGAAAEMFDEEYEAGLALNRDILQAIERQEYASTSCGPMIVLAATRA